jgi:hypothetical protein
VTLRQIPGAIVLGLVAALVTHAVLFGKEHAWGGAYHSTFIELTLAAVTGLTSAAGALLWSGARCTADGTVLAARVRSMLPSWGGIATLGAAWFTLGERLEAAHAGAPLLAIVVILALTAWIMLRFVSAALRALAGIVFAIATACRVIDLSLGKLGIARGAPPLNIARDTVWRARLLRAPPVTANA